MKGTLAKPTSNCNCSSVSSLQAAAAMDSKSSTSSESVSSSSSTAMEMRMAVASSGPSTLPLHRSALIRELRGAAPSVVVSELDELLPPDLTNIVLQYLKHDPPRGRLSRQFGSKGQGDGQFDCPLGVAVWRGLVPVADYSNDRICVHRLSDGGFVRSFGRAAAPDDSLKVPFGIAVSEADGLAFITESPFLGDHRVSVWRLEDGSLIRQWGSKGSGVGQLNYPRGIALSSGADRLVYVADSGNHRIQVFGVDGQFVRSFGSQGSGPGQLYSPNGICLDGELLYVADYGNHRISVLSAADGSFVRHIGLGKGSDDGQLNGPQGIAVGGGWVATSEYFNHRVSVFDSADGSFLHRWGSQGSGDNEFDNLWLMCWSESHGVLVVPDTYNHRITVFH